MPQVPEMRRRTRVDRVQSDKKEAMTEYQPRYLAYCRAHGNTPDQQMQADAKAYPGGCMCGFILWINQKWAEWFGIVGRKHVLSEDDHRQFDEWLTRGTST